MFTIISLCCALVTLATVLVSYERHRDALHPAVFVGSLMFLGYGLWPSLINWNGELEYLLDPNDLARIQGYYLLCLVAFCVGLLHGINRPLNTKQLSPWQALSRSPQGKVVRGRLSKLSLWLGVAALASYLVGIQNAGGFAAAYSVFKGGGSYASGYLAEATLLSYPAAILYALANQGHGLRVSAVFVVLIMLSPNLMQGTFGVRRGPLFISMATMLISFAIIRGKVLRLSLVLPAGVLVLGSVLFVWSNRQEWFGRDSADQDSIFERLLPEQESLIENDYVAGLGSALVCDYYDRYFWGQRIAVDLFVRPIPRFLWPNKYADVGAYWAEGGNLTGFEVDQQMAALGFILPRGYSMGVLSDLYSEFWWFGFLVLYLLGRYLTWAWWKHRRVGQVWSALYLCAIGLAIYLPTQSFSAWYQRYLIMAVACFVGWRWVVGRDLARQLSPNMLPVRG